MAVAALTYSVQEAWIGESRPVEDFPLGFAHASEAGYGTAQSCYLGREVTGGRAGNHLADCLLTRDAEPYGAIRPAQLWRSGFWRHVPWDSTDCPPFAEFLEPGPLDNEAVVEWLRSEPGRARALARLLSVLEDPDVPGRDDRRRARRGAGLDRRGHAPAAHPQCGGDLLRGLHQQREPGAASHLRRAAEPEPDLVAGGRNPRFHLDATAGVADEYEISARAAFWVERLVSADDPYEVVDAVDTADALGDADGTRPDARLTAWAITAPGEPVPDPAALTRWLTGASPTALAQHGTAVAERVLDGDPGAAGLRWIDAAAASGLISVDPVRVRAALVGAEIEEARAGSRAGLAPLRRVDIGADARRDAESLVGSAILLATDDAGVDALLRVARRHSIVLPLDSLRERLHAFVVRWVAEEHTDYRPEDWALQDPILDLLHQQLTYALARRGPVPLARTIRRVWPHLIDRHRDPDEPLTWQLQAAAVEAAAPEQRADLVRTTFHGLIRSRCRPSSLDGLQRAMLDWRVVGDREALLIVTLVPPAQALHPEIESAAIRAAERRAERPDSQVLTAINALDRRDLLLPEVLIRLHESDRRMRQIAAIARNVTAEADADRLVDALELANHIEPAVAANWVGPLVRVSLDSGVSWLGAVLLSHLDEDLALRFLARWSVELEGQEGAKAASYGVCWYADHELPESLRPVILRLLTDHLDKLAAGPREQFVDLVRSRHLTDDLVPTWDALIGPDRGHQRRFGFSRERNR